MSVGMVVALAVSATLLISSGDHIARRLIAGPPKRAPEAKSALKSEPRRRPTSEPMKPDPRTVALVLQASVVVAHIAYDIVGRRSQPQSRRLDDLGNEVDELDHRLRAIER